MESFTVGRLPMVSGIGEQESIKLWEFVTDAKGTYWLWPVDHDEPGAHVHCGSTTVRSEGYGGRTMKFPTRNGVVTLLGPWHSDTDSLYERTGVDLRDKHRTFGVVAEESSHGFYATYTKLLHIDPDGGVVGRFERIKELAKKLATERKQRLYYYSESNGGSSAGSVEP